MLRSRDRMRGGSLDANCIQQPSTNGMFRKPTRLPSQRSECLHLQERPVKSSMSGDNSHSTLLSVTPANSSTNSGKATGGCPFQAENATKRRSSTRRTSNPPTTNSSTSAAIGALVEAVSGVKAPLTSVKSTPIPGSKGKGMLSLSMDSPGKNPSESQGTTTRRKFSETSVQFFKQRTVSSTQSDWSRDSMEATVEDELEDEQLERSQVKLNVNAATSNANNSCPRGGLSPVPGCGPSSYLGAAVAALAGPVADLNEHVKMKVENVAEPQEKRQSLSTHSNYFSQVIRVSWNIIEAEIIANDKFQLGHDVEKFYELNQQLTMDDLARKKLTHTQVCLVRVLNRVVRSLEDTASLQHYLRCVGRLHQLAGVDISFLELSGQAFCQALDTIEHHRELWSPQVKATWNLLFVMIVKMMKEGYDESIYRKLTSLSFDHRSLVTDVWSVLQDNAVKYVSNTMFLPLIVRSNRSLQKYFTAFEQALQGMDTAELYNGNFDRTKHGSLFLSKVLVRVLPHLEQLEVVFPYLADLGAMHERKGVKRHHIDLVGLAYCWAIRGVVQGGGVRGGPLHDTTKAWICLIQAICRGIKLGYKQPANQMQQNRKNSTDQESDGSREEEVSLGEECSAMSWRRSLRSESEGSCRLLEKRRGVAHFDGNMLEDDLARVSRRLANRRFRNRIGSCFGMG